MATPINLLGNISEKQFIKQFWGKEPHHIESVLENYHESITKKYLKTAINDERLFSKLITHNKNNYI